MITVNSPHIVVIKNAIFVLYSLAFTLCGGLQVAYEVWVIVITDQTMRSAAATAG